MERLGWIQDQAKGLLASTERSILSTTKNEKRKTDFSPGLDHVFTRNSYPWICMLTTIIFYGLWTPNGSIFVWFFSFFFFLFFHFPLPSPNTKKTTSARRHVNLTLNEQLARPFIHHLSKPCSFFLLFFRPVFGCSSIELEALARWKR